MGAAEANLTPSHLQSPGATYDPAHDVQTTRYMKSPRRLMVAEGSVGF